ncbi:PhzF family phenazine biosynthesis protein [Pseudoponticoccus marisrubri]|uniref:PhzF family phenazine biosynthesis protein n=1 Tax=Pseudoponticoccus marisrubri TaxID=1685382 RepID=UPI001F0A519B|nr:PhzF family phenazine biosynthesis protein [Pseudoponticoccus marisrubri]
MPETRPFQTWDVFTQTRFAGNPLAIVEDADGLSTAQMQTLAREFNLSETIFVQSPEDAAHSAKVRIFFPTDEIPFAGHPTIGCAIWLALKSAPEGDFETRIVLEEQAGLVPVDVSRRAGQIDACFTAPVLPHAPGTGRVPGDDLLAAAVGLTAAQIGFGTHRAGIWRGGPGFLYIPVCDLDALAASQPHRPAWDEAMQMSGMEGAYLYAPGGACDYRARMFAPDGGVPEDPATGSASAILAAQLRACGVLGDGRSQLTLHQGVEMGRPSRIGLEIRVENGALAEVRVSGSAVPVGEGRVALPPR